MPIVSRKPQAILVDVIPRDMAKTTAERRLTELEALTKTYGGIIILKVIQKRGVPDYKTYIGSGKLDEIIEFANGLNNGAIHESPLLIINNLLKPKQMFEVGERLRKHGMSVWDRVDLILKIFSKHAKTAEAKLQIKLAAIHHMGPRIFGMGMEMMQQGGGIGTRGQGETNTEIMKRHLAEQEKQVRRELDRVASSRQLHRSRRDRQGLKTVSIVGYTNAGKSSLLNALTQKGAYVANALFATLDTRVGKLWLSHLPLTRASAVSSLDLSSGRRSAETGTEGVSGQSILLSDTIGFIQDLPPQLIDAFRSTLDETIDADLILHVIDVTDPHRDAKIVEVEEILTRLGVQDVPKIYVFNKIDLAKRFGKTNLEKEYKHYTPVFVSTYSKAGLDDLKKVLTNHFK